MRRGHRGRPVAGTFVRVFVGEAARRVATTDGYARLTGRAQALRNRIFPPKSKVEVLGADGEWAYPVWTRSTSDGRGGRRRR